MPGEQNVSGQRMAGVLRDNLPIPEKEYINVKGIKLPIFFLRSVFLNNIFMPFTYLT